MVSAFSTFMQFKKQIIIISSMPSILFSNSLEDFSSTKLYNYTLKFIISMIFISVLLVYNEQNVLYYYIKKINETGDSYSLLDGTQLPTETIDTSTKSTKKDEQNNKELNSLRELIKSGNDRLLRVKSVKINFYKKFLIFNLIFFLYLMSYHHIFDEIKKISFYSYSTSSLILFTIFILFFIVIFLLKYMLKLQKNFIRKLTSKSFYSNMSNSQNSIQNNFLTSFFSSVTITYMKISLFKILFNILIILFIFFICIFVNLPSNSIFLAIFGTFSIIQANLEMSWSPINRFFLILLGIFSTILTLLNFMALTVYVSNFSMGWKEQNLDNLTILNFCIIIARMISFSSILPVFFKKNIKQDHLINVRDNDSLDMDEIPSDFLPLSYNSEIFKDYGSTSSDGSLGYFSWVKKIVNKVIDFVLSIFSEVGFLFLVFLVYSVELWILEADYSSIKIYSSHYVYPFSYFLLTSILANILSYSLWKKKFFRTYILIITILLSSIKFLYYFNFNSVLILEVAIFSIIHVIPMINRPFSFYSMDIRNILILKNTIIQKNSMKNLDKIFLNTILKNFNVKDPEKIKSNFLSELNTLGKKDFENNEEDEDIEEYLDNDEYALYNKYISKLNNRRLKKLEKTRNISEEIEDGIDSEEIEDEINDFYDLRLSRLVNGQSFDPSNSSSTSSNSSLNFLTGCIVPSLDVSFILSFIWIFLSGIFLLSPKGKNIGQLFYFLVTGNESNNFEFIFLILSFWLCFSSIIFFKFSTQLKQSTKRKSSITPQFKLPHNIVSTMSIILLILSIGIFIFTIEFLDPHREEEINTFVIQNNTIHIKFYIVLTVILSVLYWLKFFVIKNFKSFLFFASFTSYLNTKIIFYYFLPSYDIINKNNFDKNVIGLFIFVQFLIQKFLLIYPIIIKSNPNQSDRRCSNFFESLTTPFTSLNYMNDLDFISNYKIIAIVSIGINFFILLLTLKMNLSFNYNLNDFALITSLFFSYILTVTLSIKVNSPFNYVSKEPGLVSLSMAFLIFWSIINIIFHTIHLDSDILFPLLIMPVLLLNETHYPFMSFNSNISSVNSFVAKIKWRATHAWLSLCSYWWLFSALYSILLQGFFHRNESEAEHFLRENSIKSRNWLGWDKDVSIWHAYHNNHNINNYFISALHLLIVVVIFFMLKYSLYIKELNRKNEELFFIFFIFSFLLMFATSLDAIRYLLSIVIFLSYSRIYEIQTLFKDEIANDSKNVSKLSESDTAFVSSLSYY